MLQAHVCRDLRLVAAKSPLLDIGYQAEPAPHRAFACLARLQASSPADFTQTYLTCRL
jgi:hypothetical protein